MSNLLQTLGDDFDELYEQNRPKIQPTVFRGDEAVRRFREHGVSGMKWGHHGGKKDKIGPRTRRDKEPKEEKSSKPSGKPQITVLMGINGSGKSTLLKKFVDKYGSHETDIKGEKWNVVKDGGKKAMLMGNYSTDNHINGGRYFIKGNFWDLLKSGVAGMGKLGVSNLIIDARRLAYGPMHDKLVEYAKKNGIGLNFVRVQTPIDVAVKRVAGRNEAHHTKDRSSDSLERMDKKVGQVYDSKSGSPRLTLHNDKGTDLKQEAGKLGDFIFKSRTKESAFMEGQKITLPVNRLRPTQKLGYKRKQGIGKLKDRILGGEKIPPIKVRKNGRRFDILDGHHRYIAHKALGKKTIPAEILGEGETFKNRNPFR